MRPIRLTMSAFGPYAQTTVVEFNQLGKSGLYLIAGDTGSGKTYIFDGIMFALFGRLSSKSREKNSVRSQFAAASDETFVELKFAVKNKEFTVKRSPSYEREKMRGRGMTKNEAKVELITPTGVFYRASEVDKKIEEILGVNANQFLQIVMIAQGKFRETLELPSVKRNEILRHLFNTDIYSQAQDKLKTHFHELNRTQSAHEYELRGILKDLCSELQIRDDEGSEINLDDAHHVPFREILSIILQKINESEQMLQTKQDELNSFATQLADKEKIKDQLKMRRALQDQSNATNIHLQEIQKNILETKTKFEAIENKNKQIPQLLSDINLLKQKLIVVNKINELEDVQKTLNKERGISKSELDELSSKELIAKTEIEQIQKTIATQRVIFEQKQNSLDELNNLNITQRLLSMDIQLLKEVNESETKIEKLSSEIDQYKYDSTALQSKAKCYQEKKENLLVRKREYSKELEREPDCILELNEVQNRINTLAESLNEYQRIHQSQYVVEAEKKQILKHFTEVNIKCDNAYRKYSDSLKQYLASQAGQLANNLDDGAPCPVCGSVHHPKKAELFEIEITQEDLTNLNELYELACKERNKANERLTGYNILDILIKDTKEVDYDYYKKTKTSVFC